MLILNAAADVRSRARLANERYRSIDRARRLDEWRHIDGQCPKHKKADLVNVQRWLGVKALDRNRKNVQDSSAG